MGEPQGRHISYCHNQLTQRLLLSRQALVALQLDFDKIVGKAYNPVAEGQAQTRHQQNDLPPGEQFGVGALQRPAGKVQGQGAYNKGYNDPDNKHQSAHIGRALLFLMPHGANVQNGLTEVQLAQPRNDHKPQPCSDGKGHH